VTQAIQGVALLSRNSNGLRTSTLGPFLFLLLNSLDHVARKENQIGEQQQCKMMAIQKRKRCTGVVKSRGHNRQDDRDEQRQLRWWRKSKRHGVPPSAEANLRSLSRAGACVGSVLDLPRIQTGSRSLLNTVMGLLPVSTLTHGHFGTVTGSPASLHANVKSKAVSSRVRSSVCTPTGDANNPWSRVSPNGGEGVRVLAIGSTLLSANARAAFNCFDTPQRERKCACTGGSNCIELQIRFQMR
jgi:hypothetical protein